MRYRPFNQTGLTVSAITLSLDEASVSKAARVALVYAALEAGINSFELACLSPDCAEALRLAIEAAGRNVLVLTFRPPVEASLGESAPATLEGQVGACLERIGAQRFDAVLLDADGSPTSQTTARLHALRAQGLCRMIGVDCGAGGPDSDLIHAGYDLVAAPFGLRTEAGLRRRLHALVASNITFMGYGFDDIVTAKVEAEAPKGLARLFKRTPLVADTSAYEFLRRTPGWTAEAIALAYVLTEPALATMRVRTTDVTTLDQLAKAVERELPNGAAAQIEMARFTASA